MPGRRNLAGRILGWLFLYTASVSALVATGGYLIHERVEHLAWQSLLSAELEYFQQRTEIDPTYAWHDTDTLRLYGAPGTPALPRSLAALPPGLHDDQWIDGVNSAVLRAEIGDSPVAMSLDLTGFEGAEGAITVAVAGALIALILLLGLLVMWGLGREIAPLAGMARQVGQLQPGRDGAALSVPADASSELAVIAEAFNRYIDRSQRYVERERAFIATASHELRTPVAVIGGAAELVLAQADLLPLVRVQVARIARTAAGVEELINLLLMLARDPERLASISELVEVDQLLQLIVEDHQHLTARKALTLRLEPGPPCAVLAPPGILQAAVGNLLRNAIEHSDSGEIRVQLLRGGTVVIEDPGHGMTPEQVSAIYSRLARTGTDAAMPAGNRVGIGLDLLARLCEHMGWHLEFTSTPGTGTITTLHLANAARGGPGRTHAARPAARLAGE